METSKCIRSRRSVRAYKDKPVPKRSIEAIIDAGTWAPSGMNAQPWRFVVIEDRKAIGRLSARTKGILMGHEWAAGFKHLLESDTDTIFYGAPLLILMCVQRDEQWKSVNLLDCGLAAQNMLLKAWDQGIGGCFIGFGNFLNADPGSLAEVGVPQDHELVAPLVFGYPAEKPEPKARSRRILKWMPRSD